MGLVVRGGGRGGKMPRARTPENISHLPASDNVYELT